MLKKETFSIRNGITNQESKLKLVDIKHIGEHNYYIYMTVPI